MKHLLRWPGLREVGERGLLLLDYDGTLTPIAERPELALLPPDVARTLRTLSRRLKVVIMSGRSLRDLRKLVGEKGVYYGGNHGMEIEGPGISFALPKATRFRPLLRRVSRELRERMRGVKGALVEDKGLSLSLHYRLVDPKREGEVREILEEVTGPHRDRLRITEGKKVLEVRPNLPWDKGRASLLLLRLLDRGRKLPVYLGDDRTDEDAFRALNRRGGVTVLVSEKPVDSSARFFLRNPKEVALFLQKLEILSGEAEKKR
jgi:trehalose-phosphatase